MQGTLRFWVVGLLAAASVGSLCAQEIYRCSGAAGGPPEYINNSKEAQNRNCKPVSGGHVTVVRGTPVPKTTTPGTSNPGGGKPGNASAEQRARDSDSRIILETELKKAEAKLAEQQKEYNNGEPEKQGIEGRNYQRYLDRVAELKESISRQQSDIAGLKRELARLPAPAASAP